MAWSTHPIDPRGARDLVALWRALPATALCYPASALPPGLGLSVLIDTLRARAWREHCVSPTLASCADLKRSCSLGDSGRCIADLLFPMRIGGGALSWRMATLATSGPGSADEMVFHLSSGTWAMQSPLLLAANCLRFEQVRLLETSREQGVCEVRPPYVLAARDLRLSERPKVKSRLTEKARRKLLPDTVVSDSVVEAAYAALFNAATKRKRPQRILVLGPVGSGKWHACRQLARWRGAGAAHWLEPESLPDLPEGTTLLIHRLDSWPMAALKRLAPLSAERPDLAIAATFRTDQPPAVPLEVLLRDGLRGAAQVHLPALGSRADFLQIGEALSRQLGALAGYVNERLRFELETDVYPRNLHDLKALLATAVAHSPGKHPERGAYLQAKQIRDTQALLAEAWQILAGMDFGPGRHTLDELLGVIRAVVVRRALAGGRSMESAGELLGMSQQTVSTIYNKRLDLSAWRTPKEAVDGPD